jgi:mono/diheme cytochrome c family protein
MKGSIVFFVAGFSLGACAVAELHPDGDGIRAVDDPAVVERGRYLVYGPAHCAACHGDPELPYSERVPLTGGRTFDLGPLGTLTAPNITSDADAGVGAMSDAKLVRSLRYGISRKGKPLAPLMPYAAMADDDLQAVLSYLRTVPPQGQRAADHDLTLLGNLGLAFIGAEGPSERPPASVRRERTSDYGAYLANVIAGCHACHTQRSKLTGAFKGPPFAGGMTFEENGQTFTSPNLTPIAGGLVEGWVEPQFIDHFRAKAELPSDSPMPWKAFAQMTDDDLGAVYRYLRTLEPAETPR